MPGDYTSLRVIPALPNALHPPTEPDSVFQRLVGATIVSIGTAAARIEGGGLIIDYRLPGQPQVRRLVLGMNDLGMWVEFDGDAASAATRDEIRE